MNRLRALVTLLFSIVVFQTGGQQRLKAEIDSSPDRRSEKTLKDFRSLLKTEDLRGVSYIFSKSKDIRVVNGPSRRISVIVGDVSDEVLRTKIASISFNSIQRYNPKEALLLMVQTKEVQLTLRRLDVELPLIAAPGLIQEPMSHLPHLPASMRNVTLRDALDTVAQTFGGFIIYGGWTMDETKFFAVDFVSTRTFDRAKQRRKE